MLSPGALKVWQEEFGVPFPTGREADWWAAWKLTTDELPERARHMRPARTMRVFMRNLRRVFSDVLKSS